MLSAAAETAPNFQPQSSPSHQKLIYKSKKTSSAITKWSSPQTTVIPAKYIIGQIQTLNVVLILQLNDKEMWKKRHMIPVMMNLKKKPDEHYALWDVIIVSEFQIAIINGTQRRIQYFRPNIIQKCVRYGLLIPSTIASQYHWLSSQSLTVFPALVQHSAKSYNRFVASITGPMLRGPEKVDNKKIYFTELPAEGEIVEAQASLLPQSGLEYDVYYRREVYKYYLPSAYAKTECYGHQISWNRATAMAITPHSGPTFEEARIGFRHDPPERASHIRFMETLMYTSALYYEERTRETLIQSAFSPTDIVCVTQLIPVCNKQAILTFSIPYFKDPNSHASFPTRLKYWVPGSELRIENRQSSVYLTRFGMTATIMKRSITDRDLYFELYMNDEQVTIALCHAKEVLKNERHEGLLFYPSVVDEGHENIKDLFNNHRISTILLDKTQESTLRRIVLEQLFDFIPVMIPDIDDPDPDKKALISSAKFSLNSRQSSLLTALFDPTKPLVYAQAPAGTGKTYTIAAYLTELLKQSKGVALVTAPTDLSVQSLIKNLLQLNPAIEKGEILLLQSSIGEGLYDATSEDSWRSYRIPETLQYFQHQGKTEALGTYALQYVEKRLNYPRQTCYEEKALQIVLSIKKPIIVFGAVSLIPYFVSQWSERNDNNELQYLIIDGGGLISEMTLMGLIALLPNLKKALVCDDKYQLPEYGINLPKTLLNYGLRGAVQALSKNQQVAKVTLNENYRSHPVIVEALAESAYEGDLYAVRTSKERTKWQQLLLPKRYQSIPIIFFHLDIMNSYEVPRSLLSMGNESAVTVWKYIESRQIDATTTILCFYEKAAERIRAIEPQADVYTVNQFQGQESDFIILVTTRGFEEEETADEEYQILLNEQRTISALSRAKEGIFVIGEGNKLCDSSTIWNVFVRGYSQQCSMRDFSELPYEK